MRRARVGDERDARMSRTLSVACAITFITIDYVSLIVEANTSQLRGGIGTRR